MSKIKELEDVLLEELKDLFSAEKQLFRALPKMKKAAASVSLQEAFADHQLQTEEHIARLTEIEGLISTKLSGKTCKAMKGLLEEGEDAIKEKCENEFLKDALLIGAARRVEHYEIAAYSTTKAIAKELNLPKIEKLLGLTLDEESEADGILTTLLKQEVLPDCCEAEVPDCKTKTANKKKGSSVQAILMLGILSLSCIATSVTYAEQEESIENRITASEYEADNTGKNVRDRSVDGQADSQTADSQDLSDESAEILSTIRQEVLDIEDLSLNGQNVKIMVVNDTMTLKGPVASVTERDQIATTVRRVASGYQVDNQLEVTSN